MIKRYITIFIFLFGVLFALFSQSDDDYCNQVKSFINLLSKYHYQPKLITNEFYNEVSDQFFQTLDPYGIYFTSKDLIQLTILEDSIYLDNLNSFCDFFTRSANLFKQELIKADSFLNTFEKTKFDYTIKESITFSDKDDLVFAYDDKALLERWRKWIKYQTLIQLYLPIDSNHIKDPTFILTKEPEARKTVIAKEKCKIKQILSHNTGYKNYIVSIFLNAIAEMYDPHSSFFSSDMNDSFEQSLSKKAYSFGITLEKNSAGDIQIAKLIPGGPAWKSGELNKGDVLLQIGWPDGQLTDLTCIDFYEVQDLLKSSKSQRIELKIRKVNGQIKKVVLIKEEMIVDENVITSYVLDGEKKIGYIYLPGFYTEVEENSISGCANDLAKEIIKLKKENIDGLILDVRNNGGGSMIEALDLAGIFINEGPLSIYHIREEDFQVLKDLNRGTIYRGPMVVLVNKFSASASEILAAALQDYNRALIVGASTFGKATGQIVLPLETSSGSQAGAAYVKVTVNKFYRINGHSHQLKGVIPDILLQDDLGYIDFYEANCSSALPSDSIDKKVYFKPLPPLPVVELGEKSKKRTDNDKIFQEIKDLTESIKGYLKNKNTIQLDIFSFDERMKKRNNLITSIENISKRNSSSYKVNNNEYDQELIHFNKYNKEINAMNLKNIQEDIYIEEAYRIINDLINFSKN